MVFRLILCVFALGIAGCASNIPPVGGMPGLQLVQTDGLPVPAGIDVALGARPYLIGPFDKLQITVFGIEGMDQKMQVDSSGRINFPLAGEVLTTGKTPGQLASEIESRLRDKFIRNPHVSVNVEESVSQVVTVDGQVTKPGLYPVFGNMTLLRTIATAGGATEYAKLDDVVVFRTVDGVNYAGLYNLQAIRRGAYSDPQIFSNDIILVGDSPQRRMFQQFLAASGLIATPIVAIIQKF